MCARHGFEWKKLGPFSFLVQELKFASVLAKGVASDATAVPAWQASALVPSANVARSACSSLFRPRLPVLSHPPGSTNGYPKWCYRIGRFA
jgi:hypothetical protein